eukprot:COSAG02_NODE_359_length_23842_cov_22.550011_5_plen_141_part_00
MQQNRAAKRRQPGMELEPARTADELKMEKYFPRNGSRAAGSSWKGLWKGLKCQKPIERNAAGRPKFTHNSRIVNYVRGVLAAADGGDDSTDTSTKATRQLQVSPAVYCELGFVLEVLTEQLLVLHKLILFTVEDRSSTPR